MDQTEAEKAHPETEHAPEWVPGDGNLYCRVCGGDYGAPHNAGDEFDLSEPKTEPFDERTQTMNGDKDKIGYATTPDRGNTWEADAVAYLQSRGYYILDQYDRLRGNPKAMDWFKEFVERRVRDRLEDVMRRL